MVIGWTGTPGWNPPVLNLARALPLDVVPSGNINTCGHAKVDVDLLMISSDTCRLLSTVFLQLGEQNENETCLYVYNVCNTC